MIEADGKNLSAVLCGEMEKCWPDIPEQRRIV